MKVTVTASTLLNYWFSMFGGTFCNLIHPCQWRMQDFRKGGSSGREAAHLGRSGGRPPQKNFDILDALR